MGMNGFRLCGDFIHLFAFILLIRKILVNKSCAGVSGKSQLLLATVFTTRYLDLLEYYISLYNVVFKVIFIGLTYFILYLIFFKFRKTYDSKNDSFWNILIIGAVCVQSLFINYIAVNANGLVVTELYNQYLSNPLELAWTFSIYLEAVAMIPQFYMIKKTGDGQTVVYYLLALTVYRGLYVCNWIYRYYNENHVDLISTVSGTFQTVLLIIMVIYIQICKERNPKWQEITEVFTIEAAKLEDSKKNQLQSFQINRSVSEDTNHLLS